LRNTISHGFKDKIFVFIGNPKRCTRQVARDALMAVGGVVDGHIAYFTHYVVAFDNAKTTKLYKLALEREKAGFLSILSETQFFDILEGKAEPPEKKHNPNNDVIVIPAKDPEVAAREAERIQKSVITNKRMKNMAKYGVPTPEGRVKLDLNALNIAQVAAKIMKNEKDEPE